MKHKKSGNIYFTRHKCIEDFELVCGEGVLNTFPVHLHKQYCIGAIVNGNAVLTLHNREFVLCPGSLYFINPEEPHQIKPKENDGFNHVVLTFGKRFVSKYFAQSKDTFIPFSFKVPHMYIKDVLVKIMDFVAEVKAGGSPDSIEYKLMLILLEVYPVLSLEEPCGETGNVSSGFDRVTYSGIDSENTAEHNPDAVSKLVEYLEEHPRNNISLQEMAALAGLSKFHFLRLFKDKIGIPPYEYQLQLKIKLARKLLLEGYSAAFISLELGFTDQSHFIRFFKRNMGITPGQFVKFNHNL